MKLSPSERILLLLARINVDQTMFDTIVEAPEETFNWHDVARMAKRHRIAPLLYYNLLRLNKNYLVPAPVMESLKQKYDETLRRNMILYYELSKILRLHKAAGIDVIVLKGLSLANLIYGNIALRPMGDVDLLVKKEDLSRAETTLLSLGYTPTEQDLEKKKLREEDSHELVPYVKGEKGVTIDVHWAIERPDSPFQIDIDGIWERAKEAKIADVEVLVLSPEDLILHLCLHASFHHKFNIQLRNICDISETIQHYQDEIDWKKLLYAASEYGISKFIYCTLSLTREMLGTEIPDDVLNELKPDTFDPQLINLAEERILSKTSSQVAPSVVDAFSPEKLIDKLKVTLKHLFPSRSSVATRFPVSENSIFLYPFYLFYPFNFIKRRWQFLWRLTKRDKAILSEFKQAVAYKRRAEILERWLSS